MITFNHTGVYTCICGREFTNSQSFNAHKSHCKCYQESKNTLETYNRRMEAFKSIAYENHKNAHNKALQKKEKLIENWLNNKPTCERCGKVMTEKFGSGHFCSRACANTRQHREETKTKIRLKVKQSTDGRIINKLTVRTCMVCRKPITKKSKTGLCRHCLYYSDLGKLKQTKAPGGYRHGSGRGKKGWYNGLFCDSTYELVWIIYNLDHGIKFKRCRKYYKYFYNGKIHKYYPDFELEDGSLIEIKGYHNELVDIKIAGVTDVPIVVLYKKDIQFMFDYVKENYSYKTLSDLYD